LDTSGPRHSYAFFFPSQVFSPTIMSEASR
jgi:hypothetical protein